MKPMTMLWLAAGLAVAACAQGSDPEMMASGGAAGDQGPGYCETPPSDPTQQERWNELCFPDN